MEKSFKIQYFDPRTLIPYEKNAKKHDERQIKDLAAAIKSRGFDQPITVDKHRVIITGHGRREAALLAGLATVPVIVRDDLSESAVRAKRLEDNRLASIDYDAVRMQEELTELLQDDGIDIYGFEDRELKVFIEDLTEKMADDTLIDDLNEEAERQREEHKSITEEVAGGRTRIVDILGFKDVPTSDAIVVGDLLAWMEDETGLMGEAAFLAYAAKISEGVAEHG
ncbi:ParB/Srx family N-terminal domain-containing protein [Raoultella ornithinolytica]|uniref:ParB/Srx family N-terminal domain-containing protein n=1 Tax=Klebsiella grimontii TaxID=2058152 RepID=UPI0012B8B1AA|nr:ParB/Srx family N-terminal domain-containing protein [Klebsiella grimontii]EKX4892476.1 ParB N-terminal domain-containing protein [Raoultella ornithinolytica]